MVDEAEYPVLFGTTQATWGPIDLRFQLRRISDAGQVIAGLNALSHLHGQLLQDAVHAGFHMQSFDLVQF